jgi:hypothetical protein
VLDAPALDMSIGSVDGSIICADLDAPGEEMSHRRSERANGLAAAGVTLALGTVALALAPVAVAPAARVLNVHDEGRLRFVRASGSVVYDEGRVSGTFPGSARVRFLYDGEPRVSAQFTIAGGGGSVTARGTGTLSSPTSPSPSFRGHMTITGGSGRYAHIRGTGELFGVYYRRSYGLTVQAVGRLPY